jgi:poly(A) polymerase
MASDVAAEDGEGPGPSKKAKSVIPAFRFRMLLISRSESAPPSTEVDNIAERGDGPTTDGQTVVNAASLPVTAGGDPLPPASNGSEIPSDVQPPPAIQGMAPLSAAAMSSFASAANGVTSDLNATNGTEGRDSKVVLNGASAST